MPTKVRPLLTVIVPTIGRFTLEDTLNSIATQPGASDIEILVVADSHGRKVQPIKYRDLKGELFEYQWFDHNAGFNCWGHPQRNFAMPLALGRYITCLDDDDTWDPEAFKAIKEAVAKDNDPRFHIFKMKYANTGHILWSTPTLMFGNIGTPMMVFPNDPMKYGSWGRAYEGDWFFLEMTMANMGPESVTWHEEIIAHIRSALT